MTRSLRLFWVDFRFLRLGLIASLSSPGAGGLVAIHSGTNGFVIPLRL